MTANSCLPPSSWNVSIFHPDWTNLLEFRPLTGSAIRFRCYYLCVVEVLYDTRRDILFVNVDYSQGKANYKRQVRILCVLIGSPRQCCYMYLRYLHMWGKGEGDYFLVFVPRVPPTLRVCVLQQVCRAEHKVLCEDERDRVHHAAVSV